MKLQEYQAKKVFAEKGMRIPQGVVVDSLVDLENAVNEVGFPCVIKAQILMGGRGKAGLIKVVNSLEDAKGQAEQILSSQYNVKTLLIEEAVNIDKELYLSITVDPVTGSALIMACEEGGVDIEAIARHTPEKIIKEQVDIFKGLSPFQARNIMYNLGLEQNQISQGVKILLGLYDVFSTYNAELVEINPLMITKEGEIIAADGKVSLDDNSLYRHNQFEQTAEDFENEAQYEAHLEGIPYLQFDGDIGLMCAGAGLTNTVFDLIHYFNGTVANYLEFGGPNYHKAVKSMEIILKNKPKVILIVTFGTIARADIMAQGLVDAIHLLKPDIPIVAAIRGTGEEKAKELLKSVGLESLDDTEEAVKKAILLSGGGVEVR